MDGKCLNEWYGVHFVKHKPERCWFPSQICKKKNSFHESSLQSNATLGLNRGSVILLGKAGEPQLPLLIWLTETVKKKPLACFCSGIVNYYSGLEVKFQDLVGMFPMP